MNIQTRLIIIFLAVLANAYPASLDLSWQDNSDNESAFEIERSTDETVFSRIAVVPADTESYIDEGLTDGQEYFYRVRAVNQYGFTGYTNTASGIASGEVPSDPGQLQTQPPQPVISITVNADGSIDITLVNSSPPSQ